MRPGNWVVKDTVGLGMDGFAERLAKLRREAEREWKRRSTQRKRAKGDPSPRRVDWRRLGVALLDGALRLLVIVALPFAVLVRSAVFFYEHGQVPTWLALLVAAVLTIGVVTVYASWLSQRLTGRTRVLALAKWVAVPLVVFYCGYSLVYLSRVNAKAGPVRDYYTAVHPLLRLALSTWVLVDPDIVITDTRRAREDYSRMKLPVNEASLHYRQVDGWVHAVDLRTARRGWLRSRLVQAYFWAMGFDTERHVGTADHLHVELH
jgi:hypothetical protein